VGGGVVGGGEGGGGGVGGGGGGGGGGLFLGNAGGRRGGGFTEEGIPLPPAVDGAAPNLKLSEQGKRTAPSSFKQRSAERPGSKSTEEKNTFRQEGENILMQQQIYEGSSSSLEQRRLEEGGLPIAKTSRHLLSSIL